MNLTNFRFETDADGIALISWDMPGRSMNVINSEVVGELGQIVDKIASDEAIKGAVFTSGKEGFAAGADLTMLETAGKEYARRAKAEGKDTAMRAFVDGDEAIVARLPSPRDLRQTCGRRDQRRVHGRRFRTGAGVPLPHRCGNGQGARRTAGDQGRPLPRRRRNAARRAAHANAGRVADAAQGRSDPPGRGEEDGPRARGRASPIRSSRSPRPG